MLRLIQPTALTVNPSSVGISNFICSPRFGSSAGFKCLIFKQVLLVRYPISYHLILVGLLSTKLIVLYSASELTVISSGDGEFSKTLRRLSTVVVTNF